MKKIIKINSIGTAEISFIIHVNNICNFKCHYCTAGKHRTYGSLDLNDIKSIVKSIEVIFIKNKDIKVNIDLNGGEPTLHNDLFIFVKELLLFKKNNSFTNMNINITTNLYRILYYKNDLIDLKGNKNFGFEISYHFSIYKDKLDKFIESINFLIKNDLLFTIKFLLPDNNERLDVFLDYKEKIFKSTGLDESNCYYDLIIVTNGVVSDSYSKEILDYYFSNNKISFKDSKLKVVFDDGSDDVLDMHDIRSKGINKFKGCDCYYISDTITEINVSHEKYITFGPCYAINALKYNISDLEYLLEEGDKKIMCFEEYCDRGINLKKEFNIEYNSVKKIEDILKKRFGNLGNIELKDVGIILGKNIKLLFRYGDLFIYVYIEKQNGDKYLYVKDGIGFYFVLKDINNIRLDIKTIDNGVFVVNFFKKIIEFLKFYNSILYK